MLDVKNKNARVQNINLNHKFAPNRANRRLQSPILSTFQRSHYQNVTLDTDVSQAPKLRNAIEINLQQTRRLPTAHQNLQELEIMQSKQPSLLQPPPTANVMRSPPPAPSRYDHMHEKTYITTYVPKFNLDKLSNSAFQVPDVAPSNRFRNATFYQKLQNGGKSLPNSPTNSRSTAKPRIRLAPSKLQSPPSRMSNSMPSTPNEAIQIQVPGTVEKIVRVKVRRKMIFIPDGQNLETVKCAKVFMESYLGVEPGPLAQHRFEQLLEVISIQLGRPFSYIFTLTGKPIEAIYQIPENTDALIISQKSTFVGFKHQVENRENYLSDAMTGWIADHKNDKGLRIRQRKEFPKPPRQRAESQDNPRLLNQSYNGSYTFEQSKPVSRAGSRAASRSSFSRAASPRQNLHSSQGRNS